MQPHVDQQPGRAGATAATVLVIDDHELVRESVTMALRARGVVAHACMAHSLPEIYAQAARYPAGLVLLDLDLGVDRDGQPIDGADAVTGLRSLGWSVLVVSGSDHRWHGHLAAAIAAGAVGQVSKSVPFSALVHAVRQALTGVPLMTDGELREWLELNRRHLADSQRRADLLARLSVRELLVLERLASGHRAVEIAAEFVVSLSTVRSQIRSILAKLDVSSQLGAVALVRELGMGRSDRRNRPSTQR